jgi:subtilisin family serine protease
MYMSYNGDGNYFSRYEFDVSGKIEVIEFNPEIKPLSQIYSSSHLSKRPLDKDNKVLVGLMDTGVDYNLADIANKLWRKVDDKGMEIVGYDFADKDKLPFDYDVKTPFSRVIHHGTGVAGVILEGTDDLLLLPIRFIPGDSSAYDAVQFARSVGAKIINLSAGSSNLDQWLQLSEVIANSHDLLFVVSAGNEGINIDQAPYFPAAFKWENILVVTSVDKDDKLAALANYGKLTVDIAAYGEDVYVLNPNNGYSRASGTSYAAASVTRLAAQLLSINPSFTPSELIRVLMTSAKKKPELAEFTKSGGIIDVVLAKRLAMVASSYSSSEKNTSDDLPR